MGGSVAFLDRDGTLNVTVPPPGFVTRPEEIEIVPGAAGAVARLAAAGIALVVISNQRGVALGLMDEAALACVNATLNAALGGAITGFYSCVHGDEDGCHCRKPKPGLIEDAFAEHPEFDRSRAVMVGDAPRDVEAGRRAGLPTVAVAPAGTETGADHVAADLATAVPWILARLGS